MSYEAIELTLRGWMQESEDLAVFALLALRVAGLFVVLPFFRSELLGWRLRIATVSVFAGSFFVANVPVAPEVTNSSVSDPALWGRLGSELCLGALLGSLVLSVLWIVRASSRLMSQQVGLDNASVVDPGTATRSDALSSFHAVMTGALFFAAGFHRELIAALIRSFESAPVGSLTLDVIPGLSFELAMAIAPGLFVSALHLAVPILALGFLLSLAQGVFTRILPNVEVFVLGSPLRLLLGFVVLAWTLPHSEAAVSWLFDSAIDSGSEWVRRIAP